MCLRVMTKDRGYWKEIHQNIIIYNQDICSTQYPLRIQNIELSIQKVYKEIIPHQIGFISQMFNQLFIVIETRRYSQFAKFEIDTLKMKKTHKIFQEYLFFGNPIFQDHHRIFYYVQGKRLVIIHKNKLIQKLKCDISKILPEQLLIRMTMKFFNSFRQFSINSVVNKLQTTFEQLLNIQISQINQEHGNHIFKRIGDFIILKHQRSFLLKEQPKIPTYYIEVSILNEMTGLYGSMELEINEKLKLIKVFNNKLYILTMTRQSMNIFRIQDQQRILIFYKNYECRTFRKPIFNQKYLVSSHRYHPTSEPKIKKIDLEQL